MLPVERRELIVEAVRKAGRDVILPRFRNLDPDQVSEKSSAIDLVTVADKEAEALIIAELAAAWPEALVFGEETIAERPEMLDGMLDAEWCVIIDPVDGTLNFATDLATFGTIIAVLHKGQRVWGMIYDPSFDDWLEVGVGEGVRMVTSEGGARPLVAKPGADALSDLSGFVPQYLFSAQKREVLAPKLLAFGRIHTLRCSAHEYRQVALGHYDFVVAEGLNAWDHMTGALAVEELGGRAALIDERPYNGLGPGGPLIIARTPAIWQKVVDHLRPVLQG